MEVPLKDLTDLVELRTPQVYAGAPPPASKRALDMTGAALGLVVAGPLILLLALVIKLTSRGPVFFTQPRMGRGGRCFNMIKFRTMYVDAEARLGEVLAACPERRREYDTFHKLRRDPRVTWAGRLLRKYSLDELPQLWNILRGEMSLVGPRPYLPIERRKMNGSERTILSVTPGLTGYWQVHARNRVAFEERVEMDLHYVRMRSLRLDVGLLRRTVMVVLRGRHAS